MRDFFNGCFRAVALVAVALLPAACIMDDSSAPMEKATVTMTFTTRAVTDVTGSNLPADEQMKTLRIIMAKSGSNGQAFGDILYNVYYSDLQNVKSKTVTFNDILVDADNGTSFDFYAIANEASFLSSGESIDGKNVDLAALKQRIVTAKYDVPLTNSIPQTKFDSYTVMPNQNQSFTMKLEFPVAKVVLRFINDMGYDATITDVKLPGADADKGHLFVPVPFVLPEGLTYGDVSFGNVEVPYMAGASATNPSAEVVRYIYPCQVNSGVCLATTWGGGKNTQLQENGVSLTKLYAGKQLNVNISLSSWKLFYEVKDWDDESIDIDFEDVLTYTKGTWKEGTINTGKALPTVWLKNDANNPAQFTFSIEAPVSAEWVVTLDDYAHFDVQPREGKAVGADGKPLNQTITVSLKDPESEETYRTKLHFFAKIGGQMFELNMVEGSDADGMKNFELLQSL